MINEKKRKEIDSHWKDVMTLAKKYGFITSAGGGVAVLATHEEQLSVFGEEDYLFRQSKMFKNDMTEENENE